MISLATFTTPEHDCVYRPGETARLNYDVMAVISPEEYEAKMNAGWRHFGHSLFTHSCPGCSACQSLRIPVKLFEPNRSQRRAVAANQDLTISIHEPAVTDEKLELYDRFHAAQSERIGWPFHGLKEAKEYHDSFVQQPFRVEEWQYRLDGRLVGVGYVDPLPQSLSAIYFFHEPEERKRSLGTFNVLKIIESAVTRRKAYVHMGFHVEGCRSLEYKARFEPHERLGRDGIWRRH